MFYIVYDTETQSESGIKLLKFSPQVLCMWTNNIIIVWIRVIGIESNDYTSESQYDYMLSELIL